MGAFITLVLILILVLWAISASQKPAEQPRGPSTTQHNRSRESRETRDTSSRGGARISVEIRTGRGSSVTKEEAYQESTKTWVTPGESVVVAGRTISDGMIYVGKELRAPEGYGQTDPALINPTLNARAKRADRSGQHLDYWPSYDSIPRSSRAAYLDWLEAGRRDPNAGIGYVFLFFYGLERRILFDIEQAEAAKKDLPALLEEIEALRDVYADKSDSFNSYSQNLVEYIRFAYDLLEPVPSPAAPNDVVRRGLPIQEKVTLGKMIKQGRPIPAEWALAWLWHHPDTRLRTPARRCREAFGELFQRRYREWFSEGVTARFNRRTLNVTYKPATSALRRPVRQHLNDTADANRHSLPDAITQLADSVQEALDQYSRWIGRRDDRDSLAALGWLPQELIRDRAGEDARTFIEEIESWLGGGDCVVVPSMRIVEAWPSKNDDYLTKTEAQALSRFLAGFDLGIEPDVRYTRNPSKRDHVTLFRLQGEDKPPGEDFEAARLLLHLAAAVAGADDEIAPEEERHIEAYLEKTLDLTPAERMRLHAYVERLLAHPPTLRGVRRRAEELSTDQRRRLATFLLTVAGADGRLEGNELTLLEKIYDILGLEPSHVHQDLHKMSARPPGGHDRGPVTVIEADPSNDRYAVPDDSGSPEEANDQVQHFELDVNRVAAVQKETKDVARVLEEVFEDEDDGEHEPATPTYSIDGLSDNHQAFIRELSAQDAWPRGEFERIAEHYELVPGFAIEQINAVCFELADEPLLEGHDPIELNPHALDALRS